MTDILALAAELELKVEWQDKPAIITTAEYVTMVIDGIRDMFIAQGRYLTFNDDLFETDVVEGIELISSMSYDLENDEHNYVMAHAQIVFFSKIRTQVNNVIGHTTDAYSQTHADKPFKYLSDTIAELKQEKRELLARMSRYTTL
jgi:hypothetical protein